MTNSNISPIRSDAEQSAALDRIARQRGDGSGGGGDMEARFSRVEGELNDLRKDMTEVKVTLARIEATLSSKVDYKWMTAYVLGIAALVLREEIARLFGG